MQTLTNTKHAATCEMAFGRKDPSCPRCQELIAGAPAREGWQGRHFAAKAQREQAFRDALRTHDCERSNCGPVCTFGDW